MTRGASAADLALVARLRAGEEAAYRELVSLHHGRLLALARTILRNPATVEEVVQETWLAVVAHVGTFEGRSRLSTWIMEILLNKARSRASRDNRFVSFADLPTSADDDAWEADDHRFRSDGHWADPVATWEHLDPERIVAGRELWAHVARALEALPAAQRAVVMMRDVDGLEFDEIERLLGVSRGNIRVLLHRGRARLRAAIDALDGRGSGGSHANVSGRHQPIRNAGRPAPSDPSGGAQRALPDLPASRTCRHEGERS